MTDTIVSGLYRPMEDALTEVLKRGAEELISDGLHCFRAIEEVNCEHDRIVCGGGKASVKESEFYWVNTTLGNLKSALRSTYHAIRPKYAQRYLSEFTYRFNRRFNLQDMIARLSYISLRTPPMPERLLRIGGN